MSGRVQAACTSATKSIYRGYVMLAHRASLESVSMKYSYITYYDTNNTEYLLNTTIIYQVISDTRTKFVCFVKWDYETSFVNVCRWVTILSYGVDCPESRSTSQLSSGKFPTNKRDFFFIHLINFVVVGLSFPITRGKIYDYWVGTRISITYRPTKIST